MAVLLVVVVEEVKEEVVGVGVVKVVALVRVMDPEAARAMVEKHKE